MMAKKAKSESKQWDIAANSVVERLIREEGYTREEAHAAIQKMWMAMARGVGYRKPKSKKT